MGKASQKLTTVQISQLDDKNCTRYGTGNACEVLVKWHPRERFPQENPSLRDCELNLIHGIYLRARESVTRFRPQGYMMQDKFCAVTIFWFIYFLIYFTFGPATVLKNWTKGTRLSIKYLSQNLGLGCVSITSPNNSQEPRTLEISQKRVPCSLDTIIHNVM